MRPLLIIAGIFFCVPLPFKINTQINDNNEFRSVYSYDLKTCRLDTEMDKLLKILEEINPDQTFYLLLNKLTPDATKNPLVISINQLSQQEITICFYVCQFLLKTLKPGFLLEVPPLQYPGLPRSIPEFCQSL